MSDSFISFDDTHNDLNTLDQNDDNNANVITDISQQINETHDSDQDGII